MVRLYQKKMKKKIIMNGSKMRLDAILRNVLAGFYRIHLRATPSFCYQCTEIYRTTALRWSFVLCQSQFEPIKPYELTR